MTDIEIANSIKPIKIRQVAKDLGITPRYLVTYGDYKAKVTKPAKPREDSKLVLVTAINPTSAGIGKTTVSIGLADALKLCSPFYTCGGGKNCGFSFFALGNGI